MLYTMFPRPFTIREGVATPDYHITKIAQPPRPKMPPNLAYPVEHIYLPKTVQGTEFGPWRWHMRKLVLHSTEQKVGVAKIFR